MILLLGASGYIGRAFSAELSRRKYPFQPLARATLDYTNFDLFFDYVRKTKPRFIINAAGITGGSNTDSCESARGETLQANAVLPHMLGRVCLMTNTPWGHVSSGSIYSGAKITEDNSTTLARDLNRPELRKLFSEHPERFHGFTELDEPNFSFRSPPSDFYNGSKALGEEAIRGVPQCYIWRLRIPFDQFDHPRNYLTKIQHSPAIHDAVNSLSHRSDFVRACLDLWERKADFGTYNVVNPGAVTTRKVVEKIIRILKPSRSFEFLDDNDQICSSGMDAPRANCILDASRLLRTGIKMRTVEEALDDSLNRWQFTGESLRLAVGLDQLPSDRFKEHWSEPALSHPSELLDAIASTRQWLRA